MTHRGGNRTGEITPQDALRYNAHPDQLLREVPEEAWGRTLRMIEREVTRWEAQQTPQQTAWVSEWHQRHYRGTLTAARAIIAARS